VSTGQGSELMVLMVGGALEGRYRLDEKLGEGSMGEVWRATDMRLDREVAVKILKRNWAGEVDDEKLARFRREGRAAARLSHHPHIAVVYDVGEHDGLPFLVMESLRGPDLATLLSRQPEGLRVEAALEFGAQVAEGLAAAHQQGVIHRDIKPSNLMLDQHGRVKICDFGIARLQDGTASLGNPIGTPAYTAPEQANGQSVGSATDVYALGATLFHLLTGHFVFPGDTWMEMLSQLHLKPPPAPSSHRSDLPATLDRYLLALLAKDPAWRPAIENIPRGLRALAAQPSRALALLADAECLARTIAYEGRQAYALAEVAKVLAAIDPVRARALLVDAERLARTINGDHACLLGDVVEALAAVSPADAERLARTITNELQQARALVEVAKALAAVDPADAERLARTITNELQQARALAEVAKALAAVDPAHARVLLADIERLACTISDEGRQASLLAQVAGTLATVDPARARALLSDIERLARTITNERRRTYALAEVTGVLAPMDPADAERLARTISDKGRQASLLAQVAGVLAAVDPARARDLLSDIERLARTISDEGRQASLLAEVAGTLAVVDPADAERLARTITDEWKRGEALVEVAKVLVATDPGDAERLARGIAHETWQASALTAIARIVLSGDPSGSVSR